MVGWCKTVFVCRRVFPQTAIDVNVNPFRADACPFSVCSATDVLVRGFWGGSRGERDGRQGGGWVEKGDDIAVHESNLKLS